MVGNYLFKAHKIEITSNRTDKILLSDGIFDESLNISSDRDNLSLELQPVIYNDFNRFNKISNACRH